VAGCSKRVGVAGELWLAGGAGVGKERWEWLAALGLPGSAGVGRGPWDWQASLGLAGCAGLAGSAGLEGGPGLAGRAGAGKGRWGSQEGKSRSGVLALLGVRQGAGWSCYEEHNNLAFSLQGEVAPEGEHVVRSDVLTTFMPFSCPPGLQPAWWTTEAQLKPSGQLKSIHAADEKLSQGTRDRDCSWRPHPRFATGTGPACL